MNEQDHTEFVTRGGAHEHRYKNGGLLRWCPSHRCTLEEFKRRCEADSQKLCGTPEPHFFEEGMLKPTCRFCGLPKSAECHRPQQPTPAVPAPAIAESPKMKPCFNCNGSGKLTELPYDECWVCDGTGRLPLPPAVPAPEPAAQVVEELIRLRAENEALRDELTKANHLIERDDILNITEGSYEWMEAYGLEITAGVDLINARLRRERDAAETALAAAREEIATLKQHLSS